MLEANFQQQQQHFQSLQPESLSIDPETIKQIPEKVDLQFQSLSLQSPEEDERKTSSGGNRQIDVKVDTAVKERGKAMVRPNPMAETTSKSDQQSTGDLYFNNIADLRKRSVEVRNPRSCVQRLHRRCLFMAKPPALVAVTFPWDRERDSRIEQINGRAEASDVPVVSAATPMKLLVEGGIMSVVPPCAVMKLLVEEGAATKSRSEVVERGGVRDGGITLRDDEITLPPGFSMRKMKHMVRERRHWKFPEKGQ